VVAERDPDDSEDHLDLDQMPISGNDKNTTLIIGQRETYVRALVGAAPCTVLFTMTPVLTHTYLSMLPDLLDHPNPVIRRSLLR